MRRLALFVLPLVVVLGAGCGIGSDSEDTQKLERQVTKLRARVGELEKALAGTVGVLEEVASVVGDLEDEVGTGFGFSSLNDRVGDIEYELGL